MTTATDSTPAEEGEAVAFPLLLDHGDTWTIETSRTRTATANGQSTETVSTALYQAIFGAAEGERWLTLVPLASSSTGDLPGDLGLGEFDQTLEFAVDESLAPLRMLNWDVLQPHICGYVESIAGSREVGAAISSMFAQMTDETAPTMLARFLLFLSLGQGRSLWVDKPLGYKTTLPSPTGGPAMTGYAQFELESLDPDASRAVINWRQSIDPDSFVECVGGLTASLKASAGLADDGDEMQAALAKVDIRRNDHCRIELNTWCGLAVRTEFSSHLEMLSEGEWTRRADIWTIIQSLPEPA